MRCCACLPLCFHALLTLNRFFNLRCCSSFSGVRSGVAISVQGQLQLLRCTVGMGGVGATAVQVGVDAAVAGQEEERGAEGEGEGGGRGQLSMVECSISAAGGAGIDVRAAGGCDLRGCRYSTRLKDPSRCE